MQIKIVLFCATLSGCSLFQKKTDPIPQITQPQTATTNPAAVFRELPDFEIVSKGAPVDVKPSSLVAKPRSQDEEKISQVLLKYLSSIKVQRSNLFVLHTKTGVWQNLPFPSSESINGVWGQAPGDVFLVGSAGTILYSADKGASWEKQQSNTQHHLYSVWGQGDVVLAVGANRTLLRSEDKGRHWSTIDIDIEQIYAIEGNKDAIFIGGSEGGIARSTDKGKTWQFLVTNTASEIYSLWMSPKSIYAGGQGGLFLRSVTNGDTWQSPPTGLYDDVFGISGFSERELYAIGAYQMILRVFKGKSEYQTSDDSDYPPNLLEMAFLPDGQAWVVGQYGTCFYSKDPTDDDKQPTWLRGECPFPDEAMTSLWFAPWGGLYAAGTQRIYEGVDKASRGLASLDGDLVQQGFDSLSENAGEDGGDESLWLHELALTYARYLQKDPTNMQMNLGELFFRYDGQSLDFEASLWRLLGQSFQEGGDTYQAQVAYSFAQSIEPKEEIAKKQSELKICLADTKTNKIPGEPFENWKAIWTTLHRDDTPEDMDADGDPDKPLWQPKNDEEARKDLCNCQGKGPWLIRTEHTDEAGYPPEGTHLIMPKGKKFVVFPWLGRYTSDEGDLGNLRIAEETSEEPKGVFRVRLDSQQSVDGQTIAEIKRELYFDIASQQQILAITRDAFPRIPATDYDTASEFTQFVKLSLKDGVVSLQGGGCNETIPIKK